MTQNKIGNALKTIAILIFIFGIIAAFICGAVFPAYEYHSYFDYYSDEYNWTLVIEIIIASIVTGIVFLGFSEIINLLQGILDIQRKEVQNDPPSPKKTQENNLIQNLKNTFNL